MYIYKLDDKTTYIKTLYYISRLKQFYLITYLIIYFYLINKSIYII